MTAQSKELRMRRPFEAAEQFVIQPPRAARRSGEAMTAPTPERAENASARGRPASAGSAAGLVTAWRPAHLEPYTLYNAATYLNRIRLDFPVERARFKNVCTWCHHQFETPERISCGSKSAVGGLHKGRHRLTHVKPLVNCYRAKEHGRVSERQRPMRFHEGVATRHHRRTYWA